MTAGTQLENMVFEVVNSEGIVDDTIHNEEKNGQSHMLTIKAELLNTDETIRYTFKHGRCTIPFILLPHKGGVFSFIASHSRHPELSLSVEVGTPLQRLFLVTTYGVLIVKTYVGVCNANCESRV